MKHIFSFFLLLSLLVSCSNDPYDTGNGAYSDMRAEFVELLTDNASHVVNMNTDGNVHLVLSSAYQVKWCEKADTVYRALAYYKPVTTSQGAECAELMGLTQVMVAHPYAATAYKNGVKTDPVTFYSAWKSSNNKYVNLEFDIKTGAVDGTIGQQTVGVVCDAVESQTKGGKLFRLRLYHDQNNVPTYYSTKLYLSVPLSALPTTCAAGDSIAFTVNTFKGETVKGIAL